MSERATPLSVLGAHPELLEDTLAMLGPSRAGIVENIPDASTFDEASLTICTAAAIVATIMSAPPGAEGSLRSRWEAICGSPIDSAILMFDVLIAAQTS